MNCKIVSEYDSQKPKKRTYIRTLKYFSLLKQGNGNGCIEF